MRGCHPPSQVRSPLFPHPEGGQCAWGAPSHRVLRALIVRTHLGPEDEPGGPPGSGRTEAQGQCRAREQQ